jgi:dGTPase
LEVSQIARDLARWLHLNEDLAEAIALGHDLGHPPFGHAGEEALRAKMKSFNSTFEHNAQSLRIVEFFEQRYSQFSGLNLTAEVREGLQKHTTFFDRPGSTIFSPHLEAQLVDISDEIAYLSADLEDGIRGGFFTIEDLNEVSLCREVLEQLPEKERSFRSAVMRGVIRRLLTEIVTATKENLDAYNIATLEDVQNSQKKIVKFSPAFFEQLKEVRRFLMDRYYSAPEVKKNTERGQQIVSDIFDYLHTNPNQLPTYLHSDDPLEIRICDYIAGMTDRFAEGFLE